MTVKTKAAPRLSESFAHSAEARAELRLSNRILRSIRKNYIFCLMLLPSFVMLVMFAYVPMAGITVAFRNYNFTDGLFRSPWIGMRNFEFLFLSGRLQMLIMNTIYYNIVFLVTNTIFAITIAIFISEIKSRYFKKIGQSLIFLPNFMSWVVIASIFYGLTHPHMGFISNLFREPLMLQADPYVWRWLMPVLNIWRSAGFGSVIYLAAIMSLDQECYEAARIDGANVFQEIWHITLPMLRPTIVILTLLSLGGILRGNFDMFFNMIGNNGLLFRTTDIIDTFVFRTLVVNTNIAMASAAGFFQSVFCFIFIVICNSIVKIIEPDYALF